MRSNWLVIFGILLSCVRSSSPEASPQVPASPAHQVFAVRFASIRYSVGQLVAGGDRNQALDIAMMVWPVKLAGGGVLLVDAGFARQKFIDQWKPSGYERPSDALMSALGIAAGDVTDIVLTHVHWDHADGADLFPRARGLDPEGGVRALCRRQRMLSLAGAATRVVPGHDPAVFERFPSVRPGAVRID